MPRATKKMPDDATIARAFRKLQREIDHPEMAKELETAKRLLSQVLTGDDVLTDHKWMRAAKRLVDS